MGKFEAGLSATVEHHDVIEGSQNSDGFDLKLHRTRWPAKGEGVFQASASFIEMQLGRCKVSASYVASGAGGYTELANVSFVPQSVPLYCRISPGVQRCVSCMFDMTVLARRAALEWQWPSFALSDSLGMHNEYARIGMRRLAEEALSPGFASATQIECTLLWVALELRRHLGGGRAAKVKAGKLSGRQLLLLRTMLVECRGQPPGIGELAAACGLGGRQLAASYRATTGVTLRSFIADAGLERAKRLLLARDTLVKQVAFDSGFQSSAAFAAAFRRSTGMTPLDYRRCMGAAALA